MSEITICKHPVIFVCIVSLSILCRLHFFTILHTSYRRHSFSSDCMQACRLAWIVQEPAMLGSNPSTLLKGQRGFLPHLSLACGEGLTDNAPSRAAWCAPCPTSTASVLTITSKFQQSLIVCALVSIQRLAPLVALPCCESSRPTFQELSSLFTLILGYFKCPIRGELSSIGYTVAILEQFHP